MADVKLPTEEELEKLFHERGHDALVWYVWRNVLRILPLLGCYIHKISWSNNHIYDLIRVSLVLAQWVKIIEQRNIAVAITKAVTIAIHDATLKKVNVNILSSIRSAAFTASNGEATRAYEVMKYVSNELLYAREDWHDILNKLKSAARHDYRLLIQQSRNLDDFWLKEKSLWIKQDLFDSQPKGWQKCCKLLTDHLNDLKLDFLAQDLNSLWDGKPLGAHAVNYLNEYSETVLNDPVALRRAILGEAQIEKIHAVRVLLLGPGGAGKSSLADRLQGKAEIELSKTSTQGIYLSSEKLNLNQIFPRLDLPQRELDLYLWDFGGQTIFHGLHSAFLHENCVYVLVVDSRHEQAPDYWLQQIRHLTDAKAKVLLVTNWHEFCETKQNETRLLREFGDLLTENSFFYFSCHQPQAEDFKKFLYALVEMVSDSQRMVLKETLDAQVSLKQLYKDNIFLEVDQLDDLLEQLPKRLGEVSQLKANLEQLGFIIFVDGDKQDYCLNPVWSVTKAYAILSSKVLRQANGLLKLAALQEAFKNQIERKYIKFLVELLQTRLLCRKVEFDNCYFFPDAAPTNEPATLNDLLQQENKLSLRFDLDHLPLGLHARLVHHLFKPHCDIAIKNVQSIWRHGFILQSSKAQAIVQYILPKSSIEFIMLGDVKEFASLLGTFYRELKNNVATKETIKPNHIHAFVCGDTNQLFAVHSAQELVKVLEQVTDYDQLFEVVRKMLGTCNITVINGQLINGNNNEQISNLHNKTP